MRKLITTVLFSAITASAYAAPITFTDVVDPNPNHLFDGSSGSNATHSFTHSILDDGYDAATDAITSLSIALRFSDESNDAAAESVSFLFDGTVFGAQTITSGGSTFSATFSNPSLIALLADGAVTVTLNNAGTTTGNQNNRSDFLFLDSTLTVNVERSVASPIATPNAVPEPGSLALVALAMGAALLRRKPAV